MTNKEASVIVECMLINMAGEYADREMPIGIKRKFDALEKSKEALEMQIKLKEWIAGYSKNDNPLLLDREDLISILKEFEVDK